MGLADKGCTEYNDCILIAWRVFVHDYWIVETILVFTSIFVEMGCILYLYPLFFLFFFIGPESGHHLPLSVTG